jgi:HSP20 family protein
MALARRDRFEVPELFRRLFDTEWQTGWLRVEEFLDGDTFVLRAEMPDLDPEKDVELTVADGVLHIRAHREQKAERTEKDLYRTEFRYGSYVRDVRLPSGVTEEDVTAGYKDGVLEIRVPIPAEPKAEPTRIPVTRPEA